MSRSPLRTSAISAVTFVQDTQAFQTLTNANRYLLVGRGAGTGGAGVAYATPALWVGVAGVAYGALSIVGKKSK